jgi:pyruvate/2-oxoacid:ferredoxin oxidoreductase beta subunit/Pyruvate/2-oxoacid:ferredoxin oxidoreductase gamma subunit
MDSFLNPDRPPVFCPGCSHSPVTKALDRALAGIGLSGNQVALVSDIGCSGLFDTFFNTHAFHGLHGRALTYATGIKMACPDITVIVTLGDGGLGIGGAHFLAACRRNLDLSLLVLNNFNFGMTGGQASATTPDTATVSSGFLNRLEKPMDVYQSAKAAGAPCIFRCSSYDKKLSDIIRKAIDFKGFSIVDIWGVCPGRYTKRNRLTPKAIESALNTLPSTEGRIEENIRQEYGSHYRKLSETHPKPKMPDSVSTTLQPPQNSRQEILLLGGAGQRVITAGELFCLAGMSGGLYATQKNEYNITVLRGPAISEIILSPEAINYTGIRCPDWIIALHQEGIERRKSVFSQSGKNTTLMRVEGVKIPDTFQGRIITINLKTIGIASADAALGALGYLSHHNLITSHEMLLKAIYVKFKGPLLEKALEVISKIRQLD